MSWARQAAGKVRPYRNANSSGRRMPKRQSWLCEYREMCLMPCTAKSPKALKPFRGGDTEHAGGRSLLVPQRRRGCMAMRSQWPATDVVMEVHWCTPALVTGCSRGRNTWQWRNTPQWRRRSIITGRANLRPTAIVVQYEACGTLAASADDAKLKTLPESMACLGSLGLVFH